MEAWLFPGQGSQHAGMGAGVLDRYPKHLATAGRVLGFSVAEVCADRERLGSTRYAQPALFLVDALTYLARLDDGAAPPAALAGHSLGELVALWAAGCMDLETALRIVWHRGELMERAAGGTMAAVIGLPAERVIRLLEGGAVDVANLNSAEQTVISGPSEAVAALAVPVREAGGRFVRLNVAAAFHSRYMREAAEAFGQAIADVPFAPPRVPVIANATARPYPDTGIGALLTEQISGPVRWRDSMRTLLGLGVTEVAEVGPGTTLTGLWRACRTEPPARPAPPPPTDPPRSPPAAEAASSAEEAARQLGSAAFRRDYGIRYAYLAGSMFRGISSAELVIRMGEAGLMSFFGSGGLPLDAVEKAMITIRSALAGRANFGVNLLYGPGEQELERATVELLLRHDVRFAEAAGYTRITAPLVRFRFAGAHRDAAGRPVAVRHVLAKASRLEVAEAFMRPPPAAILDRLVAEGALTREEAEAAHGLPVAGDVCAEADSAGHTDGAAMPVLVPAFTRLRDAVMDAERYAEPLRVGASGGLGCPEAVAAAFVLGADFVVTGSVNQCTPEAGTSEAVKDALADLTEHDTAYAPAGDMFELGARVQVMRKGTLFAARANQLYRLFRQHDSLEEIDAHTRATIERTYFRRSLDEIWRETREHYLAGRDPGQAARAEADPKVKMALVFRAYLARTTVAALQGRADDRVNFQVHCGPAMGAFNRYAAGTALADRRARHVDVVAESLMRGAAERLRGPGRPGGLSASSSSP
ncbi:MAG: PfaD family polyunsaturated fatty acid/polyketide biosynthesis protein [Streptosporangiales bacterium]|nr:PfaD family polyunsaturated fatty acid/polyketide biosynthesis protein [Streptosporangiales bacterium]